MAANKRERGWPSSGRGSTSATERSALAIYEDLLAGKFEHRAAALGQIVKLTRETDLKRAKQRRGLLIHLPDSAGALRRARLWSRRPLDSGPGQARSNFVSAL